ncbi:MAG: outer membrane beta-barrel protein [Pseudomonadota bacterium]|nr:outer membrane beta-barrel protein [Pseudomonadota bacterium]
MHKYLLATAAAVAVAATPAMARDGSGYVGVEGGILFVQDRDVEYQGFDGGLDTEFEIEHNMGFDLDFIAGYDFGPVRAEAELGYKRAGVDGITNVDDDDDIFDEEFDFDDDGGKARTVSAMANLLADFGSDDGISGYIGGGVGVARTTIKLDAISFGATDSNLAWQIIAGVRTAITPNLDAGLKYRFFNTKYNVEETQTEEIIGKFRSHSLLASLIYNFGAPAVMLPPPPPPPPPMEAPATQTCPDGTVILATEICPVPPPPPPPPPAGERG